VQPDSRRVQWPDTPAWRRAKWTVNCSGDRLDWIRRVVPTRPTRPIRPIRPIRPTDLPSYPSCSILPVLPVLAVLFDSSYSIHPICPGRGDSRGSAWPAASVSTGPASSGPYVGTCSQADHTSVVSRCREPPRPLRVVWSSTLFHFFSRGALFLFILKYPALRLEAFRGRSSP
jgi:hypothetical protein